MILFPLIFATFITSVSTAILASTKMGKHAGWWAGAALASIAVAVGLQLPHVGISESIEWIPVLGINLAFRLDGLSLLFALIVLVVGALVMSYAASYVSAQRPKVFYLLLSGFAVAMMMLVLANDVVIMWGAWELTTLCSFLLISQTGPKGREPAFRTFMVTFIGGLALLGAIAGMRGVVGTTSITDILTSQTWKYNTHWLMVTAILVCVAAATKAAQFPFHAWLPDAMVASTPVSAYLHAAAMVKAGIYLLLRFSPLLSNSSAWGWILCTIGGFTALFGAAVALTRYDMKEMLAYSTISQLGFLVTLIGVGTKLALIAALIHVTAHALFKSALFMSVGMIDHQTGTRDIRKLNGLAKTMPVTITLLSLAAASMAGIPLLLGFVSKEAIFHSVESYPLVMVVLVVSAAFTMGYSLRLVLSVALGKPQACGPDQIVPCEAPVKMWLPVSVAVAAGIIFGIYPSLLEHFINPAASAILGEGVSAHMRLWHGFNLPLCLSGVAILGGILLFWQQEDVGNMVLACKPPMSALQVVNLIRDILVRLGRRVGRITLYDGVAHHILPVSILLCGFLALLTLPVSQRLDVGWGLPQDWLILLLTVSAIAVLLRARTRVGLVTGVGVVGFAMSLLYFILGAPDVALTGLLVETLTVLIMVMLLVRLPDTFHKTPPSRRGMALFVGALVFVGGFCLTLAILGTQPAEFIGDWYLANAYQYTHGQNVVNTILVDFRAMDTLGEMTALGLAGVVLKVIVDARGLLPLGKTPITAKRGDPALHPRDNLVVLRVVSVAVGPLLILMSAWLFFRGHNEPGGGFIAALVAASVLELIYLSSADQAVNRLRWRASAFIGGGMLVSLITGLLGYTHGAFLKSFDIHLGPISFNSTLMFDLGVFLVVLGLVMAAIGRLGVQGRQESPPVRRRNRVNVLMEDK